MYSFKNVYGFVSHKTTNKKLVISWFEIKNNKPNFLAETNSKTIGASRGLECSYELLRKLNIPFNKQFQIANELFKKIK